MTVLVVLLALVVALLAVLVIGLLRSHAEILRRLHELGAGIYDDDEGTTVTSPTSTTGGVRSPVELRTRPGVPEPRSAEGLVATDAHDIAGVTPTGSATMAGVVGTGHTTLLAFLCAGIVLGHLVRGVPRVGLAGPRPVGLGLVAGRAVPVGVRRVSGAR